MVGLDSLLRLLSEAHSPVCATATQPYRRVLTHTLLLEEFHFCASLVVRRSCRRRTGQRIGYVGSLPRAPEYDIFQPSQALQDLLVCNRLAGRRLRVQLTCDATANAVSTGQLAIAFQLPGAAELAGHRSLTRGAVLDLPRTKRAYHGLSGVIIARDNKEMAGSRVRGDSVDTNGKRNRRNRLTLTGRESLVVRDTPRMFRGRFL